MKFELHITDLGQNASYFADRFINHLVTKINKSMPEHVKIQAQSQRDTMRDMALWFIDRAINSDRHRIETELRLRGHIEAADYVKTGVVYNDT